MRPWSATCPTTRPDWPAVYTALRGLCYAEISVRTLERDLHSGTYGGVAPNAIETLVRILSELKSESGEIRIPELYEAVEPPTETELETWKKLPFDREALSRGGGDGQGADRAARSHRVRASLGTADLRDPRDSRRLRRGRRQDRHPRPGNRQGQPSPGPGPRVRESWPGARTSGGRGCPQMGRGQGHPAARWRCGAGGRQCSRPSESWTRPSNR